MPAESELLRNVHLAILTAGLLAADAAAVFLLHRYSKRKSRSRIRELQQLASTLGYSFQANASVPCQQLPLFQRGGFSGKCECVLSGHTEAGEVLLFDYQYLQSLGDSARSCEQSVAAIHLRGAGLPQFALRPLRVPKMAGLLLPRQRILAHGPSGQKVLITGSELQRCRELFGGAVLSFFEAGRCHLEHAAGWLLLYRPGCKLNPSEMHLLLQQVCRLGQALVSREMVQRSGMGA